MNNSFQTDLKYGIPVMQSSVFGLQTDSLHEVNVLYLKIIENVFPILNILLFCMVSVPY